VGIDWEMIEKWVARFSFLKDIFVPPIKKIQLDYHQLNHHYRRTRSPWMWMGLAMAFIALSALLQSCCLKLSLPFTFVTWK
jgi:hypothetical protein